MVGEDSTAGVAKDASPAAGAQKPRGWGADEPGFESPGAQAIGGARLHNSLVAPIEAAAAVVTDCGFHSLQTSSSPC